MVKVKRVYNYVPPTQTITSRFLEHRLHLKASSTHVPINIKLRGSVTKHEYPDIWGKLYLFSWELTLPQQAGEGWTNESKRVIRHLIDVPHVLNEEISKDILS